MFYQGDLGAGLQVPGGLSQDGDKHGPDLSLQQNISILYRYNGDCWSSPADNIFIKTCLGTCEDLEKNFSIAYLQSVRTVVQELQHMTDILWILILVLGIYR